MGAEHRDDDLHFETVELTDPLPEPLEQEPQTCVECGEVVVHWVRCVALTEDAPAAFLCWRCWS